MSGGELRVTWLGHASVSIDLPGTRILTDPLLRRHNGPLRRRHPVPRSEQWRGAEGVLISHLHHDHAELSSLRMLGRIPIWSAPANAAWLRHRGLAGQPFDPTGGWVRIADGGYGPIEARQVRADHHDRPMPHRPNEANGHLVRGSGWRLYVVGDSELTDDMSRMSEWAGGQIDVLVVPIAGWGPKLSEGHLNPERAALACARVGARWVLPYHSGTLHPPLVGRFGDWLDRPLHEFGTALATMAPGTRLAPIAGRPGVGWQVPREASNR